MKHRSWTAGIVVLGALATGAFVNRAALDASLDLDDFAQRAMIEGKLTPKRASFNLYDFISDDNRTALLDRGVIPWWSDPRLAIRFARPLPSVLVWLDHRLFGWDAFAPHVLSFLWWVAAVLAAHTLYRTAVERRPALVATAIFALSPTLAIPLVWLANRNILVTLTFGAFALALYVRWRNERLRILGLATAAAFGATALTGEYALCLVGYLVAFEVCRRGEPARRRVTGALPAAVPFVIYAAAHAALGYGAVGSGFYRDPIDNPTAYLQALPRAASTLFAAAWLGVDVTSSWLTSHALRTILILGGCALVVYTAWSAQRGRSGPDASGGSWLASGSVIALLPLAVTEPSRRLLGVVALGVGGAVGVLIDRGLRRLRRPLQLSALLVVAAVAGFIHLAAAPFQTRRLSRDALEDQTDSLRRFATVPRRAPSVDTTLVVRANYGLTVLSAPFILRDEAPKRWRVLSHTFAQTAAIRTSPSAIEIVQDNVPLFPLGTTGIVRTVPFTVGDVVEIPGMRATVLRIDDAGTPTNVRYEFDHDLDSSEVTWISEGRSGFSDIDPRPPLGVGVRLPP
jgi:hypothetical protein